MQNVKYAINMLATDIFLLTENILRYIYHTIIKIHTNSYYINKEIYILLLLNKQLSSMSIIEKKDYLIFNQG